MLPSRFQQIRDRTIAAVDTVFAEPVRISPMKGGQPDPAHPQITIEAPLRTGADKQSGIQGGSGRSWQSRIAAGQAELRIDRTKYPDLVVKKGYAVRAMSRPGLPAFEVLFVNDRDHTRLIVGLGQK